MLRLIADIHGYSDKYERLVGDAEYSIQLGDFGFDYGVLDNYNKDRHKVLRGNHDNYDVSHPNLLDDFGTLSLGLFNVFYIRGGHSIDRQYRLDDEARTGYKSWWKEEELTYKQGIDCIEAYKQSKPDLVVAHSCPASVARIIGNPNILRSWGYNPDWNSSTQCLLQSMYEEWQPKLFVHAHFHQSNDFYIKDTRFVCVNQYCAVDINENLEMFSV